MQVVRVPRFASRRLIATLLVMLGAGAAVGPVLAPKLLSKTAVTATQALQIYDGTIAPGNLDVTTVPCDGTESSGSCNTVIPLPANTRWYKSVSDDRTKFTVAIDMFPTSSYLRIHVPIINRSNNQVLARLKLNVPDGLDYYVSPYYDAVGQADALGLNPSLPDDPQGLLDSTKAIYNLIRIDANTWEIKMMPSAVHPTFNPNAMGGPIGDVFDVHLDLALSNGTPPGFYLITGTVDALNV